jgi:4-hydroxy-tetrahydrodipicolinate reductase
MGRMNLAAAFASDACEIAAASEHPESKWIGCDVGELIGEGPLGILVAADPDPVFAQSDVVIDFTLPEPSLRHVASAVRHKTSLVLGTTGLSAAQQADVEKAANEVAILQAANMSLGVNLLLELVTQAAAVLTPDFDIEVLEMHHRHKVDAPSGTALALGEAAAAGRQVSLEEVSQRVRDGYTGERQRGDIGFATLRGGDVAGEHSVIFAGAGERIELTHKATTREIFVRGALRAALWLAGRPAGLYSMKDVLGLKRGG